MTIMYNSYKIFVCFVICIATLRNCTPLTSHRFGDTTNSTISISKEVEKEISSFEKLLHKIMGNDIDQDAKLELKGKIMGNLEMLAKRAVKAEGENKLLIKNEGKLEVKKTKSYRSYLYQLLPGITQLIVGLLN